MSIDANALTQITAAVAVVGNEYLKGIASDAGKTTWSKVKQIFGWISDPEPELIATEAANALEEKPDLAPVLLELLKSECARAVAPLVRNIQVNDGGKVVIAGSVTNLTM